MTADGRGDVDTGERRTEQVVRPEGEDRLLDALSSVRQIADVRARVRQSTGWADRLSALGLGLGYLAVAVACALAADVPTPGQALRLLVLVALYVVAHRTEFVAAGGSTVPTEPVLVGMLLLTSPLLVPLAVLVALQAAGLAEPGSRYRFRDLTARMISGWHCLGPVAVLWAVPVARPDLSGWRVYLLALLAQFVLDAGSALVRASALGVPPRQLRGPLGWTFAVDALLAPLGLCVVIAAADEPFALALLAAPIGLIRLLAHDRSVQLETAVTLGTAFTAVQEEARVDVLTGLANRRAWVEALGRAQARVAADADLVAVVLVADVDGLKRINDTFGHDAGDELIHDVGHVIAAAGPPGSVAARLGGDEFGLLVVASAADGLDTSMAGTVRAALAAHPGVRGLPLAASLGVAACPPAATVVDAMTRADLAAAEDKVRRKAGRT